MKKIRNHGIVEETTLMGMVCVDVNNKNVMNSTTNPGSNSLYVHRINLTRAVLMVMKQANSPEEPIEKLCKNDSLRLKKVMKSKKWTVLVKKDLKKVSDKKRKWLKIE